MVILDEAPFYRPAVLWLQTKCMEVGDIRCSGTLVRRLPVDHNERRSALRRSEKKVVQTIITMKYGCGPIGKLILDVRDIIHELRGDFPQRRR